MSKVKNRWLIALSAIAIHLSIGSVYAYSVYQNPLSDQLGWDTTDVSLAFTIAIFMLGTSAAFLGRLVEKYGPRRSALVAAAFFGIGTLGAGFSVSLASYPLFLFFYGFIGGIGLGIGYISPVSTLVKWFPDRRGLATGMAVLGFGAGSLITGPIAGWLLIETSIPNTFYILGFVYLILMVSGAAYLEKPADGWMPKGMKSKGTSGTPVVEDLAQLTANEAVKTARFWMLWLMMFINISAGIMLLAVASPMAQEITGMSAITAASVVGLLGLFNGLGRIGWASLSDYIGRPNVYIAFFVIQVTAFFLLPNITSQVVFPILLYIIITCYGGGFASLPAFIGDLFGTKQLGAIHGYLLTSWSMAGVVGPMVVSYIYDTTQSYTTTFTIFNVLLVIALVTSLAMRLNIKKIREKQGVSDVQKPLTT